VNGGFGTAEPAQNPTVFNSQGFFVDFQVDFLIRDAFDNKAGWRSTICLAKFSGGFHFNGRHLLSLPGPVAVHHRQTAGHPPPIWSMTFSGSMTLPLVLLILSPFHRG